MSPRTRNLWVATLLLVLAVAAILLSARKAARPLPQFQQLSSFPHQRPPFLIRLVPAIGRWGWFWRARQWFFGSKKTVEIDTSVVEWDGSTDALPAGLTEGAFVGTNGLQAWLFNAQQFKAVRDRLKNLAHTEFQFPCRATSAEDVQLSMYYGPSTYGFTMDLWPRLHGSAIDLLGSFRSTDALTNGPADGRAPATVMILTNFESVVRMQITNGGGAFLVQTRSNSPSAKKKGILVSAMLPLPKK